MKKSKKKSVFVTSTTVQRLARLEGLQLPADNIFDDLFDIDLDLPPPPRRIVKGCVTMINYAGPSAEISGVAVREPGGDTSVLGDESLQGPGDIFTGNLSAYQALFEQASNFNQGVVIAMEGAQIIQMTLIRCACPCKEKFVTDTFPNTDGVAGGLDGL
jgi:hypothetical protein